MTTIAEGQQVADGHLASKAYEHVVWNRDTDKLDREPNPKGYDITYVYGHVGETKEEEPHIFNSDTQLGKFAQKMTGIYKEFVQLLDPRRHQQQPQKITDPPSAHSLGQSMQKGLGGKQDAGTGRVETKNGKEKEVNQSVANTF